jgi:hypothetical protein
MTEDVSLGHGDCRMHEERRWLVGIDWASQEHVVSLLDGWGGKIGQRNSGAGLAEMVAWLLAEVL